jgi:excinuclease ABC subunit B
VRGDTIDLYLAYTDYAIRFEFWGDEIENISTINPETGKTIEDLEDILIYPANLFVSSPENTHQAIIEIQDDLLIQIEEFQKNGKAEEAQRLKDRVEYDLEMIKELGYCSGIENYSRYFDRRLPGQRPFCLLDYFPEDYLMVIDESHVSLPQVKGMYGGDRARKTNLVEYGFRLQAAIDNRPLKFEEFENMFQQCIYVSATPADYEMEKSQGLLIEQVIRPTGLLDPVIEVKPSLNQIDTLITEIQNRIKLKERTLVTTLTKRMAEELQKYLDKMGILCRYIHSEIDTIERVEILRQLRLGQFDVLIGVNLLREGLDLPEVSFVAIIDADKEGFLRNERSLVQTVGRAARNVNGYVIMFADQITKSMKRTIDETERRRKLQMAYNKEHKLIPTALKKSKDIILESTKVADGESSTQKAERIAAIEQAPVATEFKDSKSLDKEIKRIRKLMEKSAKNLEFIEAAGYRDQMRDLQKLEKQFE